MTEPLKPSHADIYEKLGEILERLGEQDKRLVRIEGKVVAYDELKQRAYGALAALTLATAIIWWLIKDKLATFFGVTS